MESSDLSEITNGKYNHLTNKINGGAYSKIYEIQKKKTQKTKYIIKVQKISDRYEAVNEIKSLVKIKKNRDIYFNNIQNIQLKPYQNKEISKIIDIEDFYSDRENVYIVFKKYEYSLDDFNILYNKTFNETLPLDLCLKLINSLFLGLYEMSLSQIIHCDIKPNNIMITNQYNKSINELFKDIQNNKIKKEQLCNYIDIVYIDFNLAQKENAICKSVQIQTSYYMAPEIILGNTNFTSSIDIWSVGCLIYELLTGNFLFDIYNYNSQYGKYYEHYEFNNSQNKLSSYSSSYSSSYYSNKDNLILLYLYRELFGDNNFIEGTKIKDYYNSNLLMGTVSKKILNNHEFIQYIKYNIHINNNDIQNKILNLFCYIFKYDYKNRLSINDYLNNIFYE
jgi:serine/threonine protein kinase